LPSLLRLLEFSWLGRFVSFSSMFISPVFARAPLSLRPPLDTAPFFRRNRFYLHTLFFFFPGHSFARFLRFVSARHLTNKSPFLALQPSPPETEYRFFQTPGVTASFHLVPCVWVFSVPARPTAVSFEDGPPIIEVFAFSALFPFPLSIYNS